MCSERFAERADSVIAEYIFDKWLMKALCKDGNKNGLITSLPITGALQNNLSMIQEALTALISSDSDYQVVAGELPNAIF